jgi:hypothetical protein
MNADLKTCKFDTKTLSDIVLNAKTEWIYYTPWFTDGSINMLFAPTGMGKSHFAFNLGLEIAQGGTWLGNRCAKGKVLYVDGEMGGDTWVKRIMGGMIVGSLEEHFHMLCPENFKDYAIPTLANHKNHAKWIETCKDYDVIIIDNYITCCMPTDSRMSDIEIFLTVKDLLVTLKTMGKAVLVIHHTNKGNNEQHGTVYKDFWMDIIIRLKQFAVQHLENGLTWEIKYIKDRHDYYGTGFEHLMDIVFADEKVHTHMRDIKTERENLIAKWIKEGLLDEEIMYNLDVRKGLIQQIKRKINNNIKDEDLL